MPRSFVHLAASRRRKPVALLGMVGLALALVCTTAGPAGADPQIPVELPAPQAAPGRYIVTLAAAPVAAYDGGLSGYAATKPKSGQRVDLDSSSAKRYRSYLRGQQERVAKAAGVTTDQSFTVAISAFTTQMTPAEARSMAKTRGVLSVTKDVARQPTDDKNSVDYLGLSGRKGVWADLGGTGKSGRAVVVGVIDSGITPENPSFAGPALRTISTTKVGVPFLSGSGRVTLMRKGDGGYFVGECETGEEFTAADCNSKLISARSFSAGFKANVPAARRADFDSPRDTDGHGSHTAGTAAGNAGVTATVDGVNFGKVSGVAPAAKIAAYKVCFSFRDPVGNTCYTTDSLAAIEQAVIDGVDVINYSISGSQNVADPVELSFRTAAEAGIFVAASAGNDGPDPSTTNHESPWLTSVGASTVAPYYGTVTLGNGASYAGISTSLVAGDVPSAPLATSSDAGASGQTTENVRLCAPNSLDPARTAGKIIVCDRGVVDRVAKSAEVKRAGGVGMVLVNVTVLSLDGDLHAVPTVHLNPPASQAVKAYAATSGATATLRNGNQSPTEIPYPQVAGFSARGPAVAPQGDLIKPDLVAPGVAILAAYSPEHQGRNFDFLSGTSMASPHVAGLAALWLGKKPTWSPMNVKSALMTTAGNTKTATGATNRNPFDQGAGEVTPTEMFSPGLVYPSGKADWDAYLEGQGYDTGTGATAKDASDYNSPSIAVGKLLATRTVTRRVTAVERGRYTVNASVAGVGVKVTPSVLRFTKAGQTKSFKVTFTNRSVPVDEVASGFLTWRGAGNKVRIPVAVTAGLLDAPDEVPGTGATGSVSFPVTPGATGPLPLDAQGLAEMARQTGTLGLARQVQVPLTVPADAALTEVDVTTPNAGADLDLYFYRVQDSTGILVAQSATSAANERVRLPDLPAGQYVAVIDSFGLQPGTTGTPYTVDSGTVQTSAGVGDFTVSPNPIPAVAGRDATVTASWTGLSATTPYLGLVEYPDGSVTVVRVN